MCCLVEHVHYPRLCCTAGHLPALSCWADAESRDPEALLRLGKVITELGVADRWKEAEAAFSTVVALTGGDDGAATGDEDLGAVAADFLQDLQERMELVASMRSSVPSGDGKTRRKGRSRRKKGEL